MVGSPRGAPCISLHFRPCAAVHHPPPPPRPPVLTLTGRRCQCALTLTAQVNLCLAVTAPIEGGLRTRILNSRLLLPLMDSDPNFVQIYRGLSSATPPTGPRSACWSGLTATSLQFHLPTKPNQSRLQQIHVRAQMWGQFV